MGSREVAGLGGEAQVTKAVAKLPSKEAGPIHRRPLGAAKNQGWLWVDTLVAQLWKGPESPGEHLPTLLSSALTRDHRIPNLGDLGARLGIKCF